MDFALSHGGGQQVMLDLVRAVKRNGKKAIPWVAQDGWLARKLDCEDSCLVAVSPFRNRSWLPLRALRFLTYFWTLFKNREHFRRADAVIVNDPELFLPASLVAGALRVKVSLYIHMAYRGLAARVVRCTAGMRSVQRLICVSEFVERHTASNIRSVDIGKLFVVKNALSDIDSIGSDLDTPRDMSKLAIVGRLIPEKGQDVVLDLARKFPASRFFIVGPLDNADARFLRWLRECAPANVKFEGYQAFVVRYLREKCIGIVIVPSRITEACPLIPIEAVSAGCAVIARGIGGLAEVSDDVGLVTVSSDDEFAEQIAKLQSMPTNERLEMLSNSMTGVASKYSPQRFDRDIAELFQWEVK
jgi:glycosyltransferase involved in cell wall biosynthesis